MFQCFPQTVHCWGSLLGFNNGIQGDDAKQIMLKLFGVYAFHRFLVECLWRTQFSEVSSIPKDWRVGDRLLAFLRLAPTT